MVYVAQIKSQKIKMDDLPSPFLISLKDFKITGGRKRVTFNMEANTIRTFQPHDCEILNMIRKTQEKNDRIDEYRKK